MKMDFKLLMDINKLLSKIDLKNLPSVSPDSSPSDINSSSEQMLRILTSISVTKMNKNSKLYIIKYKYP